jgi:hypothetical protein
MQLARRSEIRRVVEAANVLPLDPHVGHRACHAGLCVSATGAE